MKMCKAARVNRLQLKMWMDNGNKQWTERKIVAMYESAW